MKKTRISILFLIICFQLTSCVSMTPNERAVFSEIESLGLNTKGHQVKDPGAAAALNILPGVGNFYLAAGTGESSQWAFGALNLLFWPLSIVWSVPEAGMDAVTINKKSVLDYYTLDAKGKMLLEEKRTKSAYMDAIERNTLLAKPEGRVVTPLD